MASFILSAESIAFKKDKKLLVQSLTFLTSIGSHYRHYESLEPNALLR